ncbi:hypothetical protein ACJMK2_034568 [Sinanodonta woodiana]|uniref:HMG box domain-containing protein n=1 Tax=Sinanodonta woodiana TaxID=1069815 RepID=A0ABD3WVJ5_SINWO
MFQFSITASSVLKQLIFKPCSLRCARPYVNFVRQLAVSTSELPKPPKKSPGKFFLFMQDKREQIFAENPGKKVTELAKIAGAMWNKLDEKDKKFYEEEDLKRKQEYAKEYELYLGSLTQNQINQLEVEKHQKILSRKERKQKMIQKRDEKELAKPKRPSSAYGLFMKDFYAKNASKDSVKGSSFISFKVIADVWETLSNEEKMVYSNKAAELVKEYRKDMLKWYHKMEDQGRLELLPKSYQRLATKSKPERKRKSVEKKEE